MGELVVWLDANVVQLTYKRLDVFEAREIVATRGLTRWPAINKVYERLLNGFEVKALTTLHGSPSAFNELYALSAANGDPVMMASAFMLGANDHDEALEWAAARDSVDCVQLAIQYGATAAGIDAAFRSLFETRDYGDLEPAPGSLYDLGCTFRPATAQRLYEVGISDYGFAWARRRALQIVARLTEATDPEIPDDGEESPRLRGDADIPAIVLYAEEVRAMTQTRAQYDQYAAGVKRMILTAELVSEWLERKVQPRIWGKILGAAIALAKFDLPPYVILEIFGWAFPGPLRNHRRIQLIQAVRDSIRLVLAKRQPATIGGGSNGVGASEPQPALLNFLRWPSDERIGYIHQGGRKSGWASATIDGQFGGSIRRISD